MTSSKRRTAHTKLMRGIDYAAYKASASGAAASYLPAPQPPIPAPQKNKNKKMPREEDMRIHHIKIPNEKNVYVR